MSKFIKTWDSILLLMLMIRMALEQIMAVEVMKIIIAACLMAFVTFKLAEKLD